MIFGGQTITIAYRGGDDEQEIYIPEMDGDNVNDAVFTRNQKVADRLHISFAYVPFGNGTAQDFPKEVLKSIRGNMQEFDLLAWAQYATIKMFPQHLFYNLADVPYIDYSQPWWNNDYMNALQINDSQRYLLMGDISVSALKVIGAVFFNQKLYHDFYKNPNDLYNIVQNGTWTKIHGAYCLMFRINMKNHDLKEKNIMNLFENEKVAVRRFVSEDWSDVFEMVQTNHASPFAACDELWPADEDSIREITNYIGTDDAMYAIVAKDIGRVVAFVNFNSISEENYLDIGHIMNLNYTGNGYEYEGLKLLCDHAFATMGIAGIRAYWAKDDSVKLQPLTALGMHIVATDQNNYFDGREGTFTGCELKASKEEYTAAVTAD